MYSYIWPLRSFCKLCSRKKFFNFQIESEFQKAINGMLVNL